MEPNNKTTEYLEKFKQLKLSDSSRARIKGSLEQYADFHMAPESVRVPAGDRSIEQVSQTTVWYTAFFIRSKRFTMPMLAIAAILLVGGGTSFAAQGSLPGDILYPVKVGINENVRGALAVSAESEARLQTELLAERVHEAEALQAEGRLSGELATEVRAKVAAQAEAADAAGDESEAMVAVETEQQVVASLTHFNSLITADQKIDVSTRLVTRGGSSVQTAGRTNSVAMSEMSESAVDADMTMSSTMALKPVDPNMLATNLTARVEGAVSVLGRYEAEIQAEARAQYEETLTQAHELIIEAQTQTEAEARATLNAAADLVAKVEAAISSLGQIEIDPETGAIIDLDLNATIHVDEPALPIPLSMPSDIQGNGSIDVGGGVDAMIDPVDDLIGGDSASGPETSGQSSSGSSF